MIRGFAFDPDTGTGTWGREKNMVKNLRFVPYPGVGNKAWVNLGNVVTAQDHWNELKGDDL
jgi:hypothetical protein